MNSLSKILIVAALLPASMHAADKAVAKALECLHSTVTHPGTKATLKILTSRAGNIENAAFGGSRQTYSITAQGESSWPVQYLSLWRTIYEGTHTHSMTGLNINDPITTFTKENTVPQWGNMVRIALVLLPAAALAWQARKNRRQQHEQTAE